MPAVAIVSLQVQSSYQAVPLAAGCVVSALRSDPDVASRASVRLFDFSLEDPAFAGRPARAVGEEIAERVARECGSPLMVGFSVYVWNRAALERAAERLAELVPGSFMFAGGPEITAMPPDARSPFGILVRGEGESRSRELARAWLSGESPDGLPASARRSPPEALETLVSPWLDGSLDDSVAVREHRGALWELARGCPFGCTYCYESKGERAVRHVPRARLERELVKFAEMGIERVFVLDPTYNGSRERALETLALIERVAPDIHFNFEVRAELIDRELAAAFSRIPCSLQVGLQSSNAEALKLVNRPSDMKAFAKKIALLNDAGVVFGLDLMYGLPGDSLSSFRASVDFAIDLYPNNLELFRLSVLPGTVLSDEAPSLGLDYSPEPPYHARSNRTFPAGDMERAAALARATEVFYTQGRAVSWFLSVVRPLRLKSSRFLSDFAAFIGSPSATGRFAFLAGGACADLAHADAERLQLAFIEEKYAEKGLSWAWPAARDVVTLNGAWTRAFAEGESTRLELSYDPEDLMGPDAMDLASFAESAYMESCSVLVVPGPEGPEIRAC